MEGTERRRHREVEGQRGGDIERWRDRGWKGSRVEDMVC